VPAANLLRESDDPGSVERWLGCWPGVEL